MSRRAVALATILSFWTSGAVLADARIETRERVKIHGAKGSLASILALAKSPEVNVVFVKGDRRMTRTGERAQLVDLGAEKVYDIDFEARTYTATTFEQLRTREPADPAADAQPTTAKDQEADADGQQIEIRETGRTERIAGRQCRELVLTITSVPSEESPAPDEGVVSIHLWLGPETREFNDVEAFNQRYIDKLGIAPPARSDAGDLGGAVPHLFRAVNDARRLKLDMAGSRMRTVIRLEPPEGGANSGDPDDENFDFEVPITVTTEVIKISASVTAADVAIPAGFRQAP